MKGFFALLVLSFAAVNAINYSFSDAVNGTMYSYTFATTTDINAQDRVSILKRIFVPTDAISVQLLAINVGSSPCLDPEVQIGIRGIPCATANPDFPVLGISPCDDYNEQSSDVMQEFFGFQVLDSGGIPDFAVGTYWYFSLRKENTDFGSSCNFNFSVTITTCASASQVALASSGTSLCYTPQSLTVGTPFTVTDVSVTRIFVVNFPADQQMVTVTLNTSQSVTLAGSWGFALAFNDNERCFAQTGTNSVVMKCMAVPAGNFYIALENSAATASSAAITVTTQTCATGFSGINCLSKLVAFDATKTYNGTVGPFNTTLGIIPQVIFYTDFAINSSIELNITMVNTTGLGGNLVLRAGSFPYMDTSSIVTGEGGEGEFFSEIESFPAGILFNFGDSYVGGRYYWSIANTDSSHSLGYEMTAISESGTSSTGGSSTTTGGTSATSGSTTGTGSTTKSATSTTGSASTMTMSVILLFASLVALFL